MTDTKQRFSIKAVNIGRGYSSGNPFTAMVQVENEYGNEIKVKLPEDRVLALIEQVSDLIVDALAQQFTSMREDHVAAIEEAKLKALPPALEAEATIE